VEEQTRSLSEVAGLMGVSERTVRRWIKSGRLKAYKPGRDYRIPESGLRAFIEESEISPKVPAPPSSEPTLWNGMLEDEERRERRIVFLMRDVIEEGEALEEDLKTSVEDWPLFAFYKFGLNCDRQELLYEDSSRRKRPSGELQDAKEQLDALKARVSALAGQFMETKDNDQFLSFQQFARRRRAATHQHEEGAGREANEATDTPNAGTRGTG
jgi:excisionase family DNA binding protein